MPALIEYLGHDPWPEPLDWAQRLRQARLKQGLTMEQAAAQLGVNEGTVWWWEAGRRPRQHILKRRADAFINQVVKADPQQSTADNRDADPQAPDLSTAIRSRRRELGLTQEALARRLGVNTWTILGWEDGRRTPMDRFYPTLIRFLEKDPWPTPITLADRLRAERLRRGLSQEQAAATMQVDPGSIAKWEGGRPPRHQLSFAKIDAFLDGGVRPWRNKRSPTGRIRQRRTS